MYVQVGELALVGDHSTVPLTRVSCNTFFSKSQNAQKAETLCTIFNNWNGPVLKNDVILNKTCKNSNKLEINNVI